MPSSDFLARTYENARWTDSFISPARPPAILSFPVPPERLWVNPDCGMHHLPEQVALGKLRALVQGTDIVRDELAKFFAERTDRRAERVAS